MKYKTHDQLKISFAEYGALLGTRELLKQGTLVPSNQTDCIPKVHKFNMAIAAKTFDCGSVSCIGGTMGFIMGMNKETTEIYVFETDKSKNPLRELFFPFSNSRKGNVCVTYDKIKPADAIAAINAFLQGKKILWSGALRKRISL